jgi:hypothetical protein
MEPTMAKTKSGISRRNALALTSATVAAAALPKMPALAAICEPEMVMPPMKQVVGRLGVSRAFRMTEGRMWANWRAYLREVGQTHHDDIPRWVNFRRWYLTMLLSGDAHLEPETYSDREVLKVVHRMGEELLAHRPDVPWRECVKAELLKMRALVLLCHKMPNSAIQVIRAADGGERNGSASREVGGVAFC